MSHNRVFCRGFGKNAIGVDYLEGSYSEFIYWRGGTFVRFVQSVKTDCWNQHAEGQPQEFEEVKRIASGLGEQQLSRSLICEYLKYHGVELNQIITVLGQHKWDALE